MSASQKTISTLLYIGLATLLSNSVLANEQSMPNNGCGHSWSKEQKDGHSAHFDKRMSALHTALKLSASQEAGWTEFSNKMKPAKMDNPEHQDWANLSTPDRLDRMLENMKTHEKRMSEHAATVRAFYDTLTQDQKKIFDDHFQGHRHDRPSHNKK